MRIVTEKNGWMRMTEGNDWLELSLSDRKDEFAKSFRNHAGYEKVVTGDDEYIQIHYVPENEWADEFYLIGIYPPDNNTMRGSYGYNVVCYTTESAYENRTTETETSVYKGGWQAAVDALKKLLIDNGFEDYANTL